MEIFGGAFTSQLELRRKRRRRWRRRRRRRSKRRRWRRKGTESARRTRAEARSPETAFHSTSTLHTNTIPNVLILGSFEILGSTDRAGSISSPNLPPMKQFQGSGICLITSRKLQEVWEALRVGTCIVHKGRGEGVGLPLRVSLTLQSHFSNSRAF